MSGSRRSMLRIASVSHGRCSVIASPTTSQAARATSPSSRTTWSDNMRPRATPERRSVAGRAFKGPKGQWVENVEIEMDRHMFDATGVAVCVQSIQWSLRPRRRRVSPSA